MSRRKLTGKSLTLAPQQPQQTIPVQIQITFVADGQPLAATVVQGNLPIPPEGEVAQIQVPIDARPIAKGLSEQLQTLDRRASRGGILVPKPVTPADLILTSR